MTHDGARTRTKSPAAFLLHTAAAMEGLVDGKEVRNIDLMGREIGGDVFGDRLIFVFCFFVFLLAPSAKQQDVTGSDSKIEADGTTPPRTCSGFMRSCLQVRILVCRAVQRKALEGLF